MKSTSLLLALVCILPTIDAGELPREVKALQYQREKKIAEIDLVYRRKLEELKIKYTKAGDLDAANAVVKILEKSEPVISFKEENLPENDNDLRVFLRESTWRFIGGRSITFQGNGTIKKSWGVLKPQWKVKDMKVYYEGKVFAFDETFTMIEETTKKKEMGIGRRVQK